MELVGVEIWLGRPQVARQVMTFVPYHHLRMNHVMNGLKSMIIIATVTLFFL